MAFVARLKSILGKTITTSSFKTCSNSLCISAEKKSKGETVKHIKSPQSLAYASNKINKLEHENARLLNENNRLLVMVRDLQMVAYSKGLREDQIFPKQK